MTLSTPPELARPVLNIDIEHLCSLKIPDGTGVYRHRLMVWVARVLGLGWFRFKFRVLGLATLPTDRLQ